MKTEPVQYLPIVSACRFCAKYTFIIGSMIVLLYCITHVHAVHILGLMFLAGGTMINLLMLFILLINLLIRPQHYAELLKTAAIMLFNVPVAAFYLWLAEQISQLPS